MKTLLFALIFAAFLLPSAFARQNPFEPSEPTDDQGGEISMPPPQLTAEEIALPAGASALKEIRITHQENDGSIATIDRKVDRSIDWHAPLVISQPSAAKLPRKMGVFVPVEELESVDRMRFFTAAEVLKIRTKDALIRSFFLPRPSRVALDFNSSVPLAPIAATLKGGYFSRIDLSFHDSFYRVIVTLDSYYPYTIERVADGYLLGLN